MKDAEIILGVSGGIAAYKAAILASRLAQRGAHVTVVLTKVAKEFIGAPTFAALTGRSVVTEIFDPAFPLGAHIEIARRGKVLCVAPATADCIAKFASGSADDLLSTLYLCFTGPVLVAPAMNAEMWRKDAVQRNVTQLQKDGVEIVGPDSGWLSCRDQGAGRMSEPDMILERIESAFVRNKPLSP